MLRKATATATMTSRSTARSSRPMAPGQLQLEQAGNEIGAAGGGAWRNTTPREPPMITPPKMHPRMGSIGSKVWIMWRMSMKMEEMNME